MLALVLRKDGGTLERVAGMGSLDRKGDTKGIPKVYKNNRYIGYTTIDISGI